MENVILQGDCLELMKDIPSGSVDMILADLPYGTTQNKWDSVIPMDRLWAQYERIIKPNHVVALFGSQPFTSLLVSSTVRHFKYDWVWDKRSPKGHLNCKIMPLRKHEDILIFSSGKTPYYPQMTTGK